MRLLKPMVLVIALLGLAFATGTDFTPLVPITAITVAICLAATNMLGSAVSSPALGAWS